jgi:hypothetical protein
MQWLIQLVHTLKDLSDPWGNLASVIGLVTSVIGFILIIWGVIAAKNAAEKAEAAANNAKRRILKSQAVEDCTRAILLMGQIKSMYLNSEWKNVLSKYTELQSTLVELTNNDIGLSPQEVDFIMNATTLFGQMESRIVRVVLNGKPPPDVGKAHDTIQRNINDLQRIAITIKQNT